MKQTLLAFTGLTAVALAAAAFADEGMWTFDNFPSDKVAATYGKAPDQAWLDRVMGLSVRLDTGCSASVVSKDGLVLTNHHCIVGCLGLLASEQEDLVATGIVTASRAEERQCPGAEASILQSISDVTATVKAAAEAEGVTDALTVRRAKISEIEAECAGDDAKKRCEVVPLYRGGQYHLYEYKRFQDVRMAFAPEQDAGFFGGDPDNFNFPRYAFDMALVRLYEDGAPATFGDALAFDAGGADDGELVMVSGHPGSTQRLMTVAQLELLRDDYLPFRLSYLSEIRGRLIQHGTTGEEAERQAANDLFGVENSFKAFTGRRAALADKAFFGKIAADEADLRARYAANAALAAEHGDPWATIEAAVEAQKGLWRAEELLENRMGGGSDLLNYARALVRAEAEKAKPSTERLPEFADARMASLNQFMASARPVYPDLEELSIGFWLLKLREQLSPDHPAVKAAFGSRSAEEIARDIARNSKLSDADFRKKLWSGEVSAAEADDPALALFRTLDPFARAIRKEAEDKVDGPVADAAEAIAAIRFALDGDSVYPDATFTLRLSYGAVKGWEEPGKSIPPFTYTNGLYERATGAFPFRLEQTWVAAKDRLNPQTKFNMVSTNDIIGGNSGSPLLDADGKIVGLVFDGNIHSLGGAYGFDERLNRTVAVASPIMVEALRKVYGADALADQLTVE